MTVLYDLAEIVGAEWIVFVSCFMSNQSPSRTMSMDLVRLCGMLEMLIV